MSAFLLAHRWAMALSLAVGLCTFSSYAFATLKLEDEYRGIIPMYYDDGNSYRARMQEVLDGHPSVTSSFLYEYKIDQTRVAPTGEWLYSLPAYVFGISAVQWAYFFLLPAALFLLVYFFVRQLIMEHSRDATMTAIAAGLLVVFGFEFVDYHYVLSLLHAGPPSAFVWTRPVNPIVGSLQLFGLLIILWRITDGERRFIIPAGLLVASMVGYYFAWGMGLAITGALFLLHLLQKKYDKARDVALVGIVSVAVVAPYLYGALSAFSGETGQLASMRTGMFFNHEPVVNTVLLLTTLVTMFFFLLAYRANTWRAHEKSWIFICALLIAGWMAFNQQVITGRNIWHHHFVQYTVPFSYGVLLIAGYVSVRRFCPKIWNAGMVGLIVILSAHGAYTAVNVNKAELEKFRSQQSNAPLVTWLQENGGQSCVVFPLDDETGRYINAYTQCDVYVSIAVQHGVPLERLLHNYFALLRVKGLRFEEATHYFLSNEAEVRGYMYDDWHNLFDQGVDDWFRAKVQSLTAAYAVFMQEPLDVQLRTYRIDYFVTRYPLQDTIVQQLPGLGMPQKVGEFYLYEFK